MEKCQGPCHRHVYLTSIHFEVSEMLSLMTIGKSKKWDWPIAGLLSVYDSNADVKNSHCVGQINAYHRVCSS